MNGFVCIACNCTLIGTTGTFVVYSLLYFLPTVNVNRTKNKYFDPPTDKVETGSFHTNMTS